MAVRRNLPSVLDGKRALSKTGSRLWSREPGSGSGFNFQRSSAPAGVPLARKESPRRRETRRALERVIAFYRGQGASVEVARYIRMLTP